MPKVVNVAERRNVILEAVFRLIARGGMEAASLRNVATEAELNIGSVRHYFESHDALLLAATELMAERVTARIEVHGAQLAAAFAAGDEAGMGAAVFAIYAELLPLDEERRRECSVWLAFTERARVVPEVRAAGEQIHREILAITTQLLSEFPDAEDRAVALTAGVDGLTLAAVAWPTHYPPERQERVLRLLLRQAYSRPQDGPGA